MSAPADTKLLNAVLSFYRDEIGDRYQLDNIRRFEEFEEVSDAQAHALRDYFLEQIYPPVKGRAELEEALERLRGILKSPRRLRPFMRAGLASMWKLGPNLPAAIKAGIRVLDAYHEARKLEHIMVDTAHEQGLAPKDKTDREKMIGIIADVPKKDVMRLIKDIMALFHVLSNTKMLETAVQFLTASGDIMLGKPELYDETDVAGIRLGRALVQGGLDLFLQMDPAVFDTLIAGIERVELDWYTNVTQEVRA